MTWSVLLHLGFFLSILHKLNKSCIVLHLKAQRYTLEIRDRIRPPLGLSGLPEEFEFRQKRHITARSNVERQLTVSGIVIAKGRRCRGSRHVTRS
jgi:hypothetical protein